MKKAFRVIVITAGVTAALTACSTEKGVIVEDDTMPALSGGFVESTITGGVYNAKTGYEPQLIEKLDKDTILGYAKGLDDTAMEERVNISCSYGNTVSCYTETYILESESEKPQYTVEYSYDSGVSLSKASTFVFTIYSYADWGSIMNAITKTVGMAGLSDDLTEQVLNGDTVSLVDDSGVTYHISISCQDDEEYNTAAFIIEASEPIDTTTAGIQSYGIPEPAECYFADATDAIDSAFTGSSLGLTITDGKLASDAIYKAAAECGSKDSYSMQLYYEQEFDTEGNALIDKADTAFLRVQLNAGDSSGRAASYSSTGDVSLEDEGNMGAFRDLVGESAIN